MKKEKLKSEESKTGFLDLERKYRKQLKKMTPTEKQAWLLGLKYNSYRIMFSHHRDYVVFKNKLLKKDPNFKSLVSVVNSLNLHHIYITYRHYFWERYLYFCFQYAQKYFSSRNKYPPILQLKSMKFLKAFEKYRAKWIDDDIEEVDLQNDKAFEEFNKKYYDELRKNLTDAGFSDEEINIMLDEKK